MIELVLLFLGLAGLIVGARLVVHQATDIALRYQLSDLFVGIVILAIGSDLPELVVSLDAAFHNLGEDDTSGLIIGNSIGSCFGQIGLIMGLVGFMGYLTMPKRYIFGHGGILLGSILYLALAALDGAVSRVEGAILTAAFIIYLFMLFEDAKNVEEAEGGPSHRPLWRIWSLLLVGMAILIAGSELTVAAATALATAWGVEQSFIAIVLIGVGTSLPELSISIAALAKAKHAMSVGNLIGSNIFDTLLPIGLAALIHPLTFASGLLRFDLPALFLLTLLVLIFFYRTRGLQREEATALVTLYGAYILVKLVEA